MTDQFAVLDVAVEIIVEYVYIAECVVGNGGFAVVGRVGDAGDPFLYGIV